MSGRGVGVEVSVGGRGVSIGARVGVEDGSEGRGAVEVGERVSVAGAEVICAVGSAVGVVHAARGVINRIDR